MNGAYFDPVAQSITLSANIFDVTIALDDDTVIITVENLDEGIDIHNPDDPIIWKPV